PNADGTFLEGSRRERVPFIPVTFGTPWVRWFAFRSFTRVIWFAPLVVASPALAESASDSPTVAGSSRTTSWGWRQLVREEMAKTPLPARAPAPTPSNPLLLRDVNPDATDPDVIKLAPFSVRGERMEAKLHGVLARQKQEAHDEAVLRRTGTGFHSVRFGGWTAGVLTVFGVPVAASVSLSW